MLVMVERKSKNPLYNLLMDPKFVKWRYLAFSALLFLISLREVLFTFQAGLGRLKLVGLVVVVLYYFINIMPAKLILLKWLPKYLEARKYMKFLLLSASAVLLCISIKICIEAILVKAYDLQSTLQGGISTVCLLEWSTKYITTLTCIFGIMSIFLLKFLIRENKTLKKAESEQLRLELESLKEQVDSDLLINTLHGTSLMAKDDSDKASEMIKTLSSVLRYELYDCKRTTVLLSSEIAFINNVLKLWSYQAPGLHFSVETPETPQTVLLPPMLLISLVQTVIRKIDIHNKEEHNIDIVITCKDKVVNFVCTHEPLREKVTPNAEMTKRLGMLFGENWRITCDLAKTELKFDMK